MQFLRPTHHEQFNVHKNHGYELEHNYRHGEQGVSLVFYLLNLLAFVAHIVLEMGDRTYQQAHAQESRRSIWEQLLVFFDCLEFESWDSLMKFHLCDSLPPP